MGSLRRFVQLLPGGRGASPKILIHLHPHTEGKGGGLPSMQACESPGLISALPQTCNDVTRHPSGSSPSPSPGKPPHHHHKPHLWDPRHSALL
jgi:hypothetical protein